MSDNLQKLHDTALMSVELRCRELETDLSAISQFFGQRIPADDFKEAESLQALFTGYVLRLEAALAESRAELASCQEQFRARVDASNRHDLELKEKLAEKEKELAFWVNGSNAKVFDRASKSE